MAGVYTDNQPDFSWLQPYETRTFSQFWYPIQEIGPVKNANRLVAVNLEQDGGGYRIGVCATEALEDVTVSLSLRGDCIFERHARVEPGKPFIAMATLAEAHRETDLLLCVLDGRGRELIRYGPIESIPIKLESELPAPASEPPVPAKMATNEELYLTGLHLEQYRHATRYPELYWGEALDRDSHDARSNNAMGRLQLRRGEFGKAEEHFRRALSRLTERNPNPYDGESSYHLGVVLKYQGRLPEAYAAFYKAAWNFAWQSPAYHALAAIDCLRGDFRSALEHLEHGLRTNADNLKTRDLKTAVLRHLGRTQEAIASARETLAMDPLDLRARRELDEFAILNGAADTCLDLAFDYGEAGFWADGENLIERFLAHAGASAPHPMLCYAKGWLAERRGDRAGAAQWYRAARRPLTTVSRPGSRSWWCSRRLCAMTPGMPARTTISAICSTTNTGARKPSSIGSRPAARMRTSPFPGAISALHTTTSAGSLCGRSSAMRKRVARILRTLACSMNSISFASGPAPHRRSASPNSRVTGTWSIFETISRSNSSRFVT
jgi:tetratricopeptide (TPR) repeat protein